MKKYVILFCFFCSIALTAQDRVLINGTRTTLDNIEINKIQNTDMWTEVVLVFTKRENSTATLHPPTGDSPFVLTERNGDEHVLVYQKGWDGPDAGGYGSIPMANLTEKYVSLFFNKIDNLDDIYSLSESSCEGDGCWFFNDIKLVDEKAGEELSSSFVTITSATADQNIVQDGVTGVQIFIDFRAVNLAGRPCEITLRFQDMEDDFLTTTNGKFANSNEELMVRKKIEPGYSVSGYTKITFFVPYSEFGLSSGSKDVQVDIDLNDSDGELIQHIQTSSMTLTRN